MANFRFNFLSEEIANENTDCFDSEKNHENEHENENDNDNENENVDVRIILEPESILHPTKKVSTLQFGNHTLYRLDDEDNSSNYDLVPGTYEGGRKIWECSIDLVMYLFQEFGNNCERRSVIELGCGHGLPGIAAATCGFSPIIFSDFNDDVLENLTWPTVALNIPKEIYSTPGTIGCVAGDWNHLSRLLLSGTLPYPTSYDLILTAETLYNLEAVHKVYEFLVLHLSPHGIALVASKRYYFGVGGGVRDLLHLTSQDSSLLKAQVVRIFDDGKSNIREIVQIMRK